MIEEKTTVISYKETPEKFCKYLAHDLSGALYDIQHNGVDEVCIRTIARAVWALGEVGDGGNAIVKIFKLNVKKGQDNDELT